MKNYLVLLAGVLAVANGRILQADQIEAGSVPVVVETVKPQIMLVGIGGWKSCLGQANDQYISNRFFTLIQNLRRCRPDLDISYVMYCSPGLKAIRGEGQVRYYGRFGAGMVAEQSIGQSINRHKPSANTHVVVIGHSHGGWMAMRAAICAGNVDALFTLEPISAYQCDTKDYLANRTRKIFKGRQNIVPGCRRAPTDVNRMAVLQATGGNWTNIHLAPGTDAGDVYSSAIPEAVNYQVWAPRQGKYNAHHNLGLSADTWAIIERGILATFPMHQLPTIQYIEPSIPSVEPAINSVLEGQLVPLPATEAAAVDAASF